jgi:hypothetical protein
LTELGTAPRFVTLYRASSDIETTILDMSAD